MAELNLRWRLIILSFSILTIWGTTPSPALAQLIRVEAKHVDLWVFGVRANEEDVRTKLQTEMLVRLGQIGRSLQTTDAQFEKLQLAGNGDIERFFDDVEKLRMLVAKKDGVPRDELRELNLAARELNRRMERTLFDDQSLLQKVARLIADRKTQKQADEETRQRNQARWDMEVRLFVAQVGREIPLTERQRNQLMEFVGRTPVVLQDRGAFRQIAIRLSQRPVTYLAAFLDPEQMRAMHLIFKRANAEAKVIAEGTE